MVLYEADTVFRQIFTDGRALPPDPQPSWLGYSVGAWAGDTLVVDTIGFNDKSWLDAIGHPHSEALRLTERFRRRDFGHMDEEITFDDSKMYTRPFTVKVTHRHGNRTVSRDKGDRRPERAIAIAEEHHNIVVVVV